MENSGEAPDRSDLDTLHELLLEGSPTCTRRAEAEASQWVW